MIETRSDGTGVVSLKLSANFFKSFNLISLSFRALAERIWSTFFRCCVAKFLKADATSLSTVAVWFGTPSGLTWGEAVRLVLAAGVFAGFGFNSEVALGSVAVGGVETSVLAGLGAGVGVGADTGAAGTALLFSAVTGFCSDIMAGSTGAPLTVGCPVGARRAGGVYLLLEEVSGGKSCCLRTPLYLFKRLVKRPTSTHMRNGDALILFIAIIIFGKVVSDALFLDVRIGSCATFNLSSFPVRSS